MSQHPRFFQVFVQVLTWPARVAEHRRCIAELAGLDDRALRDIGLTRQDLRDASATPLGCDPTAQLVERANERAEASLAARTLRRLPPAWRAAAE